MFTAEKGWEIDESQYLDNLISGNLQKAQEKRKFAITSHRVRTLSQPKIYLISRSQIQTAKQNLQFNLGILDSILQRKKSNHLSHLSQLSYSPNKQNFQNSQNSFRKHTSKCNIINMSNLLMNSPKTIQRSQIQLSQVLLSENNQKILLNYLHKKKYQNEKNILIYFNPSILGRVYK